ncbi:hypothetical protein KDA23_05970 [Candidatus Saccharibacteria bacterium]|nr:hypothetical protein [Candidatus Saccharibacteria bacterium]
MGSDSNLPAATEVTNQSQGELMKQAASTSSATQSSVSIQDQGTTNTTTHSGQSVSVESKSTSDASETSVRVNGRRLHVDKSGELHKTITGEDGSTTQIDVSSDNDTIGSDNSTSLSVQINNETTNTP